MHRGAKIAERCRDVKTGALNVKEAQQVQRGVKRCVEEHVGAQYCRELHTGAEGCKEVHRMA